MKNLSTSSHTSAARFLDNAIFLRLLGASFLFYFFANLCVSAASRPICSEIVSSCADQAQALALWMLVEGVAGSFFGAPVVGYVSAKMGYHAAYGSSEESGGLDLSRVSGPATLSQMRVNVDALAFGLRWTGILSWSGCLLLWT
ncbi:unnamed protein product [Amoebophrya sp. A25]|nr:unnamed protein product [Amoebophrya sp. A25]|eukprot:GSA25T00002105001.1